MIRGIVIVVLLLLLIEVEIERNYRIDPAVERDHLVRVLKTGCRAGAKGAPEWERCIYAGLREVNRLSPVEERPR